MESCLRGVFSAEADVTAVAMTISVLDVSAITSSPTCLILGVAMIPSSSVLELLWSMELTPSACFLRKEHHLLPLTVISTASCLIPSHHSYPHHSAQSRSRDVFDLLMDRFCA